jgi:uncharacterized protein YacL
MPKPDLQNLRENPALWILRVVFLLLAASISALIIRERLETPLWLAFGGMICLALAVIALDMFTKTKRLDIITAVYFGLIVGLFLTYVAQFAFDPFLDIIEPTDAPTVVGVGGDMKVLAGRPGPLHRIFPLVTGVVLCYVCISLLLQTRDDFRFIIPYVEFSKEVKGLKPYVLDTSVIIDGRIADVVETKALDSQLIMPRFVLTELQSIADSADRLRRSRGRRGLDIMNRLRANNEVDLQIFERDLPEFAGQSVDQKLVLLAKHLDGKIVTNDYNLNKVARLHGVGVINLNDVANALKPVCLPGEHLKVAIVKEGEEMGQGVGYLDDGTMVVIEGGRDQIGKTVDIAVTSVLQTSAGRMIFGKFERALVEPTARAKPSQPAEPGKRTGE